MPISVHGARRRADRRLNLSSNELLAAEVQHIHRGLDVTADADVLRCYQPTDEHAEAFARYFGVTPDELTMTPGSDSALRLIADRYVTERAGGRRVLILQDPNYIAWREAAATRSIELTPVHGPAGDTDAQAKSLLELARAETTPALIAISSPNGLSGGAVSDGILDDIAATAAERGHLLVIDACYQAFASELTAHIARRGPSVLIVQSLSKSHGLAGARVAVLSGTTDRLAALHPGPLEHSISGMSLLAARNAIQHHDSLEAIWRDVMQRRDGYARRLSDWGLTTLPSHGNFLAVRVGTPEATAEAVRRLSESGYRVRDLSALPGLAGYLRFTIADTAPMESFLDALRDTVPAQRESTLER